MGPLQPGLPSPVMLPQNWHLLIIDLKDCFFTIPLHPDDSRQAHQFFHQSARGLQRMYKISRPMARAIVAECPDCA
ncbi:POK25 protein, partial [Nyctiprogne leucopyga]|nr:POK25 protein [Nyctiprogne leucopyga]